MQVSLCGTNQNIEALSLPGGTSVIDYMGRLRSNLKGSFFRLEAERGGFQLTCILGFQVKYSYFC